MTNKRDFHPVHQDREFIKPKRSTKHSVGYDFFHVGETFEIPPGGVSHPIPTNVKAYMHEDEYLALFVRSSIGFKYQTVIANGTGIIDSDYADNPKNGGEIFIKLINHGSEPLVVENGEAFAQGIFQKFLLIDGDDYSGEERKGGIGSTTKVKVEHSKHNLDEK